MSESKKPAIPPAAKFAAESQSERRLKYGANVALTIIVVILLAGGLIYIAQANDLRKDTTSGGDYSLKPQTVKLIQNLPEKVKIVGLFKKVKSEEQEKKNADDTPEVRFQQVSDLLQEYQQKSGGKITVDMIERVAQPTKLDQFFDEVAKKYGNDVAKYKEFIDAYPVTLKAINQLAQSEIDALKKLPKPTDEKLGHLLEEVQRTLELFPKRLDEIRTDAKEELENKVPDYKRLADNVRAGLEKLNVLADAVVKQYKVSADDKATPKEFKDYFTAAIPRFEAMKKPSEELLKKADALGSIKQLDEIRQNRGIDSIVVLGEKDLKVLPVSTIYKTENPRMMDADTNVKPRFAGEQQISTALVALTSKEKRKVAFVRSGGYPLALSLPMANFEGMMSTVADRLREFNIEILEKDVSGQWAMQAMQLMQQGLPLPPEATDEQLKDAVWVVVVTPQNPRQMMTNPSASIGPKLAEHLKQGGSAMVLIAPQTEKLDFLKDWGIEAKPDYVIVHEKIEPKGARSEDTTLDWQRQQIVFAIKNYGDHPITKPLQSLESFFAPLIPVSITSAKGVKTSNLLPIPNTPPSWGESDIEPLRTGQLVKFNDKKEGVPDDLPPPLSAGAAAENDKGQRLVVFGGMEFASDDRLQIPDMEVLRTQGRLVPRYPGNAELFMNSMYWLTKMDTMIAISPTALETPRVAPMSDGLVRFWHWGVLMTAMPLLVLVAGTFVYLKRRD